MKYGRAKVLLLICLALFATGLLAAMSDFSDLPPIDLYEVRDDAMIPGHLWIRLNPKLEGHLDRLEHRDGVLSSFEIPELDELNSHFQVSKINLLYHITMQNMKFNWRHREWGFHLWYEIHFDSKEDIRDIVMAFRELKGLVEWAEPEYRKVLYGVHDMINDHEAPEAPGEESERWTPNDPYFSSQWHYHNTGQNGGTPNCDIDLPEAWDLEKGHPDVIVAVIDDGVQYNHPDLDNNMWSGLGYNFVNNSSTIYPGDHGTHVAGTIAAENNNGTGVSGVAGGNGSIKGASIMSCQVFRGNSQGGFANAPSWAADRGAAISQNSWGYSYPNQYNQAELTAINYFNANGGGTVMNGGITIFAAGNDEAEGNFYPGCYSGSFAVAATNYKDQIAWYSNWGTWVDISAPGGETFYNNDPRGVRSTVTGNSYAYFQGTSMACPHTSGVAALVLSRAHRGGISITPTELKNILRNTTDNHYAQNPGYAGKLGTGRLNAYQALLAVQPPLNPPRNLTAESSYRSVSLSWDAPEDTTPTSYVIYRNNSQLATTSNLEYTNINLTNGTTYSYYVKARYSQGDSEASNTVTATPNSYPPTNLIAQGGDSVVFLSWNAAQGRGAEEEEDDSRAMTGYRIYRNGSALTTVTSTSYADNAVTNGVTYSYYVTTVYSNPTGESAASNTAQATPIALNYGIIASGMNATGGQDGCPINVYRKSLHGQSVYTAQELLNGGFFSTAEIMQIGFYVDSAPNVPLPNFLVRMGHTSASNAASWIPESNLMTVYQTASYQPTAGGWDMLILSVPFEWNGADNIVVDTAFDMVSEESETGTVLYIDTLNGYRYGRTSTNNMGGTFSGGVTSRNKPALRMGYIGEPPVGPSGPQINVDPLELSFGAVQVGQSSVKQFTIANEGDEELYGTIITPSGYSVSSSGREEQNLRSSRSEQERNSLYFSIMPGDQKVYNLSFSPTAAGNYNGELVIESNDENNYEFLLTVTGTGVTPPSISLNNNSLSASTTNGTPVIRRFTISNSGSQNLSFNLVESPELAWFIASPTSGTVAGGGSEQITGTFAPEGLTPGNHTGSLLVNSNDPENPQLTVSLNLTVPNTAPSILLPESYEFDLYTDQNLIVDFSPYINDPDDQTLTLSSSGNNNIQVDINGLAVTFSSPNGWTGTERITFQVYDGYTQASDAVDVTVTKIMYAPTALNGFGGDRFVNLSWTAVSQASVSGYRIYRDGMFLAETSETSYIDDTVSNNVEYSYYVTSIYSNPAGESEASNTIFVTPSAIVTVILGDGTASTGSSTACPINTSRRSLHGQSVYTKAELNEAGIYGPSDISALGFYVNTVSPRALPSFIIRMKHTTASNVSSWQSASGMVTVYNNSSYTPTAGGFDMLTLDTPFTWNGEDNIVIDTAFGSMSSYSRAGTVRYTSVANGYRYVQAGITSASDQTNVFSGGSTSYYRPNVQLTFTGMPDLPPVITVSPQQLDFGEVLAGESKVMQFTIANDGEEELSGSMNTPAGYSVALAGRTVQDSGLRSKNGSDIRNTLNFNIPGGENQLYNVTFQPQAANAYNGNLSINSNDEENPVVNIQLLGSGYTHPAISINKSKLEATLPVNGQSSDSFRISNSGSRSLDFTLVEQPAVAWFSATPTSATIAGNGSRNISCSFNATGLEPGTYSSSLKVNSNDPANSQQTVELELTVQNAAPEIDLPPEFEFDMNENLIVDFSPYVSDADGHELTLTCDGNTEINVDIDGLEVTFSAPLDWYGEEDITFTVDDGYDQNEDTVQVIVNFVNTPPEIFLPDEFEFDMNESLMVDFSPFVSDADGHELTLTCDGNTEINVDIDGLEVTFSAPLDWYGEEDITFTVDDGYDQNVDTVQVIVNFVNTPPEIFLPDEFEFDMNESLIVDFSPFVSDADGHELTLSHSGSIYIDVSIEGLEVSFAAPTDWHGSEYITFTVDDGYDQASDVVRVAVNFVNTAPEINLPAEGFEFMMNGTLTVDFSAYIHDEDGDELTLSMEDGQYIQAQIDGNSVTFSAPVNWFGQELLTFTVSDGEDQAEDTVWVRVVLNHLDVPELSINLLDAGIELSWTEVPSANRYYIYRALEPYGDYGYEPLAVVMAPSLTWMDSQFLPKAFYKVVAVFEDLPAKQ